MKNGCVARCAAPSWFRFLRRAQVGGGQAFLPQQGGRGLAGGAGMAQRAKGGRAAKRPAAKPRRRAQRPHAHGDQRRIGARGGGQRRGLQKQCRVGAGPGHDGQLGNVRPGGPGTCWRGRSPGSPRCPRDAPG